MERTTPVSQTYMEGERLLALLHLLRGLLRRCPYKARSRQQLALSAGCFAYIFCVFLLELTLVSDLQRARLDLGHYFFLSH